MAVITPAGCVAGLVALLGTIDGIGQVHGQRRVMRTEADVRKRLMDPALNRMQGWFVSPSVNNTSVTERYTGYQGIGVRGGGQAMTTFQWQIEGWMSVDDAADSEATFRDLAWGVADEMNHYGTLQIVGAVHQLPADVEMFTYAVLAGMFLMHYARIGVGFKGRTVE